MYINIFDSALLSECITSADFGDYYEIALLVVIVHFLLKYMLNSEIVFCLNVQEHITECRN